MRSGVSFGNDAGANGNGLILKRLLPGRLSVFTLLAFLSVLRLAHVALADGSVPGLISANSVSGQFVVVGTHQTSPLASLPEIATNQDLVRLDPQFLAVSAERIKNSLLQKIGIPSEAMQGGTIYLTLQPARALDENVAVFPERFGSHWIYHVALPDMLPRERLARALTSVFLMDYANRNAGQHLAEVPSWLTEGLSQEILADTMQDAILSVPDQIVNNIPVEHVSLTQRNLDSMSSARAILQRYSILTFQQLCWPTDIELSGEDGGVYRASAQLFVDELLNLRNGPAKLRSALDALPRFYNWQTAFFSAFHQSFPTPLAVEKWWALQTVVFDAPSPGPQWTASVSRQRLDEILSVAADFRSTSNSLPVRAQISLQDVIKNFNSAVQTDILQAKLHDLEVAQFRMAPSLAVLAAEYRNALAGYLGEAEVSRSGAIVDKSSSRVVSARETLRVLNVLDARRRSIALATGRGWLE
ncbi:MAG TPA: hypothetical protein VGY98_15470 [Verrucomicrobiae bacterium]|nr:hypothetical protein [Verrucomicrobiae bacterium]